MTVLTEENLKKILTAETTKLNIEHHYWLKDNFLCKLGRLAPNLKTLTLKRLPISNKSFTDIMKFCKCIENLDISECPYIEESGMAQFFENNSETLKKFVAQNS